jgi:hypothetical protein
MTQLGEDRFIDGSGLYVKSQLLIDLIKEGKISISKTILYKSQVGTGGLYPFYYNDDIGGEKQIYVFIGNTMAWFSSKFNKVTIYLNENDTTHFNKFGEYLKRIGKTIKLDCKEGLVKTKEDSKSSINAKFYMKNDKISANVLDLSKGGKKIETLDEYTKCEGYFVVRITGIYKGSLGANVVSHLIEAWITPGGGISNVISRFLGQSLSNLSLTDDIDDMENDSNIEITNKKGGEVISLKKCIIYCILLRQLHRTNFFICSSLSFINFQGGIYLFLFFVLVILVHLVNTFFISLYRKGISISHNNIMK